MCVFRSRIAHLRWFFAWIERFGERGLQDSVRFVVGDEVEPLIALLSLRMLGSCQSHGCRPMSRIADRRGRARRPRRRDGMAAGCGVAPLNDMARPWPLDLPVLCTVPTRCTDAASPVSHVTRASDENGVCADGAVRGHFY